ncbi:hypothetical protein PYW07_006051 [Mythimna separata]|uniref:ABC transporter domain-containing protein n=1 Tax=Mythimna separata TaxID=271217 RepID=A0AAD7YL52_MYTSE|nr:hypothetical protein PYW07_006051 [Mythimna separata]
MNFRVLSVLMWKHAVVRARRFIHTPVEFLAPIIFFLLLFKFRKYLQLSKVLGVQDPVVNTEAVSIDELEPAPDWIVYTPESLVTNSLMDEVGTKLKMQRVPSDSDHSERGYRPLAAGSKITDFAAVQMQETEAIVIFQDMSGETWPQRLNYTIRMNNNFQSESYEAHPKIPPPHESYGLTYATFMRIQWAIDSSYIKQVGGKEVSVKLSVQEFPYYRSPSNSDSDLISTLLTMLCWLSLTLTFVFLMCRLVQERSSGIQELMKMVGVSLNTLGFSHYLNVLPCALVFSIGGATLLKASSTPLIPQTSWVMIFLMLLLYFNTIVAFAFVCSYISSSTQYCTALASLAYVLLWMPSKAFIDRVSSYPVVLASGLLPHVPMQYFWKEVAALEGYSKGANFRNMLKVHAPSSLSTLACFIFMLLQAAICFVLTWYLSLVRPGKYGQALPWNFPCKVLRINKKNEVIPDDEDKDKEHQTNDPRYFEPAPANSEVGIKVANVSKVYPKHRALRNVSMEVYKGEITVLLGHNGAGKTTLMNIITGMTSATEGKVFVNGKDNVKQKREVRKNLGLCPQHNLYFEDLTVHEQIMFFTMLKKGTYREARESSRVLAGRLGIADKLRAKTSELSGGMKRRSQLACALAGGATVLVLDEPTSGLDVETRRELWDLLLSLRGERTVLISTHFMEEVDALADRVAALHAGVLKCFATTMHLKKAVGSGYRLTFTTVGKPNEPAISAVVMKHVPEASLKERTINSISYNLPAGQSGNFPALFTDLEAKRSQLKIDSIGIGASTLEEVFLKLGSDIDTSLTEEQIDTAVEPAQPPKRLTGILLYLRQFYVLLKRQFMYALHKKWTVLALQMVIPILLIFYLTKMSNNKVSGAKSAVAMNLDMYKPRGANRVLHQLSGPHVTSADVAKLQAHYPKVAFEEATDVPATMLRIGKKDIFEYNEYIAGVEVDKTDAKTLYTTIVRHAAPVSLNLLSNLLAAHSISWSDGNTITTMNHPISKELILEMPKSPKNLLILYSWASFVVFVIMATNINSIALPCQERLTGSRHIHIMSGCPPELHWLATLCFHMAQCVLFLIIPTVIAAYILDKDDTINQADFLFALAVVLFLGTLAIFAFSYLVSFNYGERGTSIVLVVCIFVFGCITAFIQSGVEMFDDARSGWFFVILLFEYIAPPHTMALAVYRCGNVARLNAWCAATKQYCPDVFVHEQGFDATKCCAGKKPRCYFCIDKFSPGKDMIIMLVQFLLLMPMVFLTQRGVFNGLVDKVMNMRYKTSEPEKKDEMVQAEKDYVSKTIKMPVKQIPDAMLVDDVHKNYPQFCRKNVNAIKGVSFSVKKGECFGLLGTNGAGKSTCFKIMTTEETATRGNIFGNGYHLRRGNSQYLQTLGYCPQFFGLDMFQTGEENLAMILTLRGFDRARVKEEVKNWIHIVGLEKYATRRVSGYSGGCVRRLGAAASLCGGSELSLLDEPTAGVDVAARRRLWTALRKALKQQRSIIITSHSMDEMEALCSRIAILSAGRVRALGTAAALRAAHASGHAVVFKIKNAQQDTTQQAGVPEVEGAKTEVERFKRKVEAKFNCTLKDEHKTMLHYHINETMPYSVLFTELESLRNEFPTLIEDYAVTETTLEEVFLSFAKEEHKEQQKKQPKGPQAV